MTTIAAVPDLAPAVGPAFTVLRVSLTDALSALALAVRARPSVPVLGGVLVEGRDGDVYLSTYDYETGVTVVLPGESVRNARAVLSFDQLNELVGAIGKGDKPQAAAGIPITVDATDPNSPHFTGDGMTVPLDTLPVDDFPTMPVNGFPTMPGVPVESLAVVGRVPFTELATRVATAAGKDTTFPVLTGLHLDFTGDGTVVAAATDRYRLTVGETDAVGDTATALLVPAAPLLKALAHLRDDDITIRVGDRLMVLSDDTVSVSIRTIDGDYPNFRSLLPTKASTSVTVDRAAFLKSADKGVGMHRALSKLKNSPVTVELADGGVTVKPTTDDPTKQSGVRATTLTGTQLGEDVTFGANPKFLLDGIKSMTGESMTVFANGPRKPVVFADDGPDCLTGPGFKYLLMPIKLGD